MPANYVFAKPYERGTVTCIYAFAAHCFKEVCLLAVYGYDIVAPIRRNLRANIPPAALRETVRLCAPDL